MVSPPLFNLSYKRRDNTMSENKKIENVGYDVTIPQTGEKGKEYLGDILINLLAVYERKNNLKGLESFRTYSRIMNAVVAAKETGFIELDSSDYSFLKDLVINDVIPSWGFNKGIVEAVEKFLSG